MDEKMKHIGDLIIKKNGKIDFEEITGTLYIRSKAIVSAPKLKIIGANLNPGPNTKLSAPKLEVIRGSSYIYDHAKLLLPKLKVIGQGLCLDDGAELSLSNLEIIGGRLAVYDNVKLLVPKLKIIGDYLRIGAESKILAPKLEIICNWLAIYDDAKPLSPNLKIIGEGIYDRTKIDFTTSNSKIKSNPVALAKALKEKSFIKIDGTLSHFISRRKIKNLTLYQVKGIGQDKVSFIVQRDNGFAHGETLEKAIESLHYKLSSRDISRFKEWKITTKVSVEEAIQAYRSITGACEFGVKNFCESIELPKTLTIKKVVELTQGQFGNKEFARFFRSI